MSYRSEASEVARETSWTFWRFLPIAVAIVVVLAIVSFGLRSVGLLGGTIVEREVFEQSFQRTAAMMERIAADEAVLAEIEQQLLNPGLDDGIRSSLQAQAAAARVRIHTTRSMQE